jgi:glycosyltransferase involved in cell wall biosynthesis
VLVEHAMWKSFGARDLLKPRAMVVLHILAPGAVGGLERVVRSLAAGHTALGHRVPVVVVLEPASSEHPFVHALRHARLEVITLPVAPRAYLAERAAFAAVCGRVRPDVVHTHGYRADLVDAGVARRLGIPTVTTVHGFTGGDWKNRLYEGLQRRALPRFDAVVAVSQAMDKRLRRAGVPTDRLHTIRNAWDDTVIFLDREAARRQLGVADGGLRMGWVGRMSHEKGPDLLLEALALLGDVPVALSMIGEGDGHRGLRQRAETLGVGDLTTWHGAVPEAAALLPAFDVFVLSSRTEGTPMVLFEAMAAGVAIVASAVGGVPDVVSPAEAILVPTEDPCAIAGAIRDVLRDPASARERARAARRRLEREFAARPWLERHEALYRALVRPRGAASADR